MKNTQEVIEVSKLQVLDCGLDRLTPEEFIEHCMWIETLIRWEEEDREDSAETDPFNYSLQQVVCESFYDPNMNDGYLQCSVCPERTCQFYFEK